MNWRRWAMLLAVLAGSVWAESGNQQRMGGGPIEAPLDVDASDASDIGLCGSSSQCTAFAAGCDVVTTTRTDGNGVFYASSCGGPVMSGTWVGSANANTCIVTSNSADMVYNAVRQ